MSLAKPYPEAPEGLGVTIDGPVLRLRLQRPERRNALTDEIVTALIHAIEAAGSDETVRVIAMTADGDHFCSGFDLATRAPSGDQRPRVGAISRRMPWQVNRLVGVMLETQTPIVVAARGWVVGLGLALVLASDIAIVADDARLRTPFTTAGFTPDSGLSWLLPRLVGVARAKQMLLLGREVSGSDAASWGLVTASAPDADVDGEADAYVQELARAATVAVGLTKLLVQRGATSDLPRHLAEEAWAMEVSSRSEDFGEYHRARREGRDPDYRGR